MTDDAARDLRETLEQMANVCSVNMELWDKHSNAVLTAAARIEALVAEKDMAWKTQVDMSERYIAASREVRKFSELADANRRRAEAAEAERERDEAREAAHYANGTAELAMKHRDTAEARVKELEEALDPFAAVAEHDIGEDEVDKDRFTPMVVNHRAPLITVGDLRRARAALARLKGEGAKPAPDVEKVAGALFRAQMISTRSWEETDEDIRESYRVNARAAIAAMEG